MSQFFWWCLLSLVMLVEQGAAARAAKVEHVYIISIDGGKPDALEKSKMPTLNRLASEGASTWTAMTIFPSITLPSHTSMLTGVASDKHHVLWNTWQPRKGVVNVPTVFAQAKEAGFTTAMFVGKEKFRHLLQPGTVDYFSFGQASIFPGMSDFSREDKAKRAGTVMAKEVATEAARYIREKKPHLCFIHFGDADSVGHKHGWGSPEQLEALGRVDQALKQVIEAINAAGIREQTVVLITADHGGHHKTHGLSVPDDMFIPWVAWGARVKSNTSISAAVATYDTCATALWLLGVPLPASLDGKPVFTAFTRDSAG